MKSDGPNVDYKSLRNLELTAYVLRDGSWYRDMLTIECSTNPVLSDSGAPLKFTFCMLKNTTQADFQLKISTPGILALGKRLQNYNFGANGFQKFLCVVDGHEKIDF